MKHYKEQGVMAVCVGRLLFSILLLATSVVALADTSDTFGGREIYSVDKLTKRMIDIYAPCDLQNLLNSAGLSIEVPQCAIGSDTAFLMVAVGGTIEEGFPLRPNLDFKPGTSNEILAIFLGRALVRGLKDHLDIKNPGSRELKSPPAFNPVNPGMVATGNRSDANIYSVYAVDRRQAIKALLNEPRFLSMTPDLAKVDIQG